MKRVSNALGYWKEVPFTWLEKEILYEGMIDLVFQEEGGLVILDYKTDRIALDEVPQRAKTYEGQMSTYARALPALTRLPVKESVLFFVRLGETFSFYPSTKNGLQ